MAPKKKETQKMSLGDFLNEPSYGGSWADEVEEHYVSGTQPLPPAERRMGGSTSAWSSNRDDRDRGYAQRDSFPQRIPDRPPYTAHLGNLSYDATQETVTEFFEGCEILNVRIIEDREQQRPKGFAYAEFGSADGLKKALELDGSSFQGRNIKVRIADPPREREGGRGDSIRDMGEWTRKGPLADLPGSRGGDRGDRRPSDFENRRGPREPREPREFGVNDENKSRDFTWERKGPLSPLPQAEHGPGSREGSRPRTNDGQRTESFRNNRRESPAAWGEGRQEGSRPRRDFSDRPDRPERPERVERAPTAAEKDMQWRERMRPDAAVKSPNQSRDGSEAPPSPAGPSPGPGPAVRPKLQLAKRTVSESTDLLSPAATGGDSKASPFGAAKPIDTATKEREIEAKRQQAIKEKREADEKAKEERRLAKEAAAKEAAEKAAAEAAKPDESDATSDVATKDEPEAEKQDAASTKTMSENGAAAEQKVPVRTREPREPREPRDRESREPREPREPRENPKSRATESGNWRSASGEQRPPRGPPSGPRRGGGPPRGPRSDGPRPPREPREPRGANGSPAGGQQQPTTPTTGEPSTPTIDEDGWTTVPNKGRRGPGPRAVA